MVVLSNDLRNLLTEDSINSIMSAGSAPNGHLTPEREELAFSDKVEVNGGEELVLTSAFQEKEVGNLDDELEKIKEYMETHISKNDGYLSVMTKKLNDIIKGFNDMEQRLIMLENRSVAQEQQQTLAPAQEVKEKEKITHPRSLASLPSEISIEKIFNCNGKRFD